MRINGYGEKNRKLLVEKYEIKPIAHVMLLKNQKKTSFTGYELKNEYYCFSYEEKENKTTDEKNSNNPKETGSFYAGKYSAEHLLKLIKHEGLPIFNPLKSKNTQAAKINGGKNRIKKEIEILISKSGKEYVTEGWHPEMEELSDSINMLIVCWNISPKYKILKNKLSIEKNERFKPDDWLIESVNQCISKDNEKRTLTEMINSLRKDNEIKEYTFERLKARLEVIGLRSYF